MTYALPLDLFAPLREGDKMSKPFLSADQFRELRERLDMTQEEVAAWGDVNVRTIQRFERGDQPVPKIWKLALDGLQRQRKT